MRAALYRKRDFIMKSATRSPGMGHPAGRSRLVLTLSPAHPPTEMVEARRAGLQVGEAR